MTRAGIPAAFFAVFLLLALLAAGGYSHAAQPQAPTPGQTQPKPQQPQAPQPEPPLVIPDWLKYPGVSAGGITFREPHVAGDEITEWASQTVAEVMTFTYADWNQQLPLLEEKFTERGWEQYTNYIRNSGLLKIVSDNRYIMSSIVENIPTLDSQGPSGDSYSWQVTAPVMSSFYREEAGADQWSQRKLYETGKIAVVITIVRVRDGGGVMGIKVDGWQVFRR